jgi:hypothetical protein
MKIRRTLYKETQPAEEDEDVVKESQRVVTCKDDVVIVRGMRKEYPEGKGKVKVTIPILYIST